MSDCGQLLNLWSKEEIADIIKVMKMEPKLTINHNDMYSIDQKNPRYHWFNYYVYDRIQNIFPECNLIFGMLLNETVPWKIHTDAYHANNINKPIGKSFLIPCSLDNDESLINDGYTIIFNETANSQDEVENLPIIQNNSLSIYDTYLSHNESDLVKKVSLKKILQWEVGSLLYWDSSLVHDSNNFLKLGRLSKQALVLHTHK